MLKDHEIAGLSLDQQIKVLHEKLEIGEAQVNKLTNEKIELQGMVESERELNMSQQAGLKREMQLKDEMIANLKLHIADMKE